MNLTDINEPGTKAWGLYQDYRRENMVVDDPDSVPFWFLEKLARARMDAIRVGLVALGADPETLRPIDKLLYGLSGGFTLDEREQIVLGILGADESSSEYYRDGDVLEPTPVEICPKCREELGSVEACTYCLSSRDAAWIGSAFAAIATTNVPGQNDRLAMAKALYGLLKKDDLANWEDRIPGIIRFWGAQPPLNVGKLSYAVSAVDAWRAQR